jgi:hypothetical protein
MQFHRASSLHVPKKRKKKIAGVAGRGNEKAQKLGFAEERSEILGGEGGERMFISKEELQPPIAVSANIHRIHVFLIRFFFFFFHSHSQDERALGCATAQILMEVRFAGRSLRQLLLSC